MRRGAGGHVHCHATDSLCHCTMSVLCSVPPFIPYSPFILCSSSFVVSLCHCTPAPLHHPITVPLYPIHRLPRPGPVLRLHRLPRRGSPLLHPHPPRLPTSPPVPRRKRPWGPSHGAPLYRGPAVQDLVGTGCPVERLHRERAGGSVWGTGARGRWVKGNACMFVGV